MNIDDKPSILESISFVAIDTETTGLNSAKDEIIEVAAVKYQNGKLISTYNSFIKPTQEIPHYIEYLTHITPAELKNAPLLPPVLTELKQFIGNSVIVGHNTRFDLDFINNKLIGLQQLPLLNPWWDTCELSRFYLPFVLNHKLTTLSEYFDIDITQAHRAINDAMATAEVLLKLCSHIILRHGLTVNARILELGKQAQLESHNVALMEILVEYQRKYAIVGQKTVPLSSNRHNIIEHKPIPTKIDTLNGIFGEDGILQKRFEHYEFRAGQLQMSQSIEQAMRQNEYLVVEAGTGVGKSFAYLIPALQFSFQNKKKVVISTNTKNLQEQLFFKDLPKLKDILSIPFQAILMKGRENYICERKWEELLHEQTRGLTAFEAQALLHLVIWKLQTLTGDVSENSSFDRTRFSLGWRRLCSDRYYCSNRKCVHYTRCYIMKLRQMVEETNLVIVNHSLLLSDLKSDHASLGEYEYLIVDEAHNIMQTAAKQLGLELSYTDLINQLNQLSKLYRKKNIAFLEQIDRALIKSVISEPEKEHIRFVSANIEQLIETNRPTIHNLFEEVTLLCEAKDSFGKYRIKEKDQQPQIFVRLGEIIAFWRDLLKQLRAMSNIFSQLSPQQMPGYDLLNEKLAGMELRAVETEKDILSLCNPDLDEYAYWLESGQKSDKTAPHGTICYAPIEVNEHLNNLVYQKVPCIVFTSATMALRNSFKFFLNQSGLNMLDEKKVNEVVVESPFDYSQQSRLLITSFLPEPADRFFLPQALETIDHTLQYTPVGTLVLFTSYKDLDAAYDKLNDHLYQQNRPLFAQGKMSNRSSLLEEFKKHSNSVLLGTNSFWEGIDVQGESLSLLILFKLPFQVPSEPIVEAYIDKLTKEKKDSFMHYLLPNALLRLRQGFGRLIRSKTDKGVIIIIDPRVETKKYGHYFKDVLPATSQIVADPMHLQNTVIDFFKKHHSHYH
jgi:ATP-dependent DNA helicase DinG